MREILFRGHDGDRWFYGVLVKAIGMWMVGDSFIGCAAVEEDSVGQYVGFQDSNGRRIFEGDILFDGDETAVVEYFEGCFVAAMTGLRINVYDFDGVVIGNIYENPELVPGYEPNE